MKALLLNDKVLRASIAMAAFLPAASFAGDTSCPDDTDFTSQNGNFISQGAKCTKSASNANSLFGSTGIFHTIANVLIYLVGAVAVIMLIIGGLRYVISQGNKESVSSAKDTILYSVIGIVVAILAYAIVNFVTGSLSPNGSGS